MTAPEAIRIRRVWSDGVLLIDAVEGVSVKDAGELLAIDMSNPPPDYAFEMQIFDAAPAAPAVQTHEAGFDLERVFTTPFKSRDTYAAEGIAKAEAS